MYVDEYCRSALKSFAVRSPKNRCPHATLHIHTYVGKSRPLSFIGAALQAGCTLSWVTYVFLQKHFCRRARATSHTYLPTLGSWRVIRESPLLMLKSLYRIIGRVNTDTGCAACRRLEGTVSCEQYTRPCLPRAFMHARYTLFCHTWHAGSACAYIPHMPVLHVRVRLIQSFY